MADLPQDADFDLDEDLFGFDTSEEVQEAPEEEEDLEAIFAAFQEEEEKEKASAAPETAAPVAAEPPVPAPQAASPAQPAGAAPAPAPAPAAPVPAAAAPAAAAAPVLSASGAAVPVLSKGIALVLISILVLNGLMAFVALRNSSSARSDLVDVQRSIVDSVRTLQEMPVPTQAVEEDSGRETLAPPDVESHPVFEQAAREIEAGEYAKARQRIYAFLAVIDRLEDSQRSKAESKAQFLLAKAIHLQALENVEAER